MGKVGNLIESRIEYIPGVAIFPVGIILFHGFQCFAAQDLQTFINAVYLFLWIRGDLRLIAPRSTELRTKLVIIFITDVADIL